MGFKKGDLVRHIEGDLAIIDSARPAVECVTRRRTHALVVVWLTGWRANGQRSFGWNSSSFENIAVISEQS